MGKITSLCSYACVRARTHTHAHTQAAALDEQIMALRQRRPSTVAHEPSTGRRSSTVAHRPSTVAHRPSTAAVPHTDSAPLSTGRTSSSKQKDSQSTVAHRPSTAAVPQTDSDSARLPTGRTRTVAHRPSTAAVPQTDSAPLSTRRARSSRKQKDSRTSSKEGPSGGPYYTQFANRRPSTSAWKPGREVIQAQFESTNALSYQNPGRAAYRASQHRRISGLCAKDCDRQFFDFPHL